MLAERLPGLLPPLDEQAALEVTAIHSVAGTLPPGAPLVTRPTVRGAAPLGHDGRAGRRRLGADPAGRAVPGAPRRAVPRRGAGVPAGGAGHAAPAAGARLGDHPPGRGLGDVPVPGAAGAGGQPLPVRQRRPATPPAPAARWSGGATSPGCPGRCSTGSTCGSTCPPVTRAAWLDGLERAGDDRRRSPRRVRRGPGRGGRSGWPAPGWRSTARCPGGCCASAGRCPRASLRLAERALERGALSVRGFDRVLRVAWTLADLAGRAVPGPDEVAEALGMRLQRVGGMNAATRTSRTPRPRPGERHPGLRRARAWLSRVVEPGTVDFWRFVDELGPVRGGAADPARRGAGRIRSPGRRPGRRRTQSLADLRRAERCGARLVIPEDDEWPALPAARADAGRRRGARRPPGPVRPDAAPVPPLALWVRGPGPAGRAGRPVGGASSGPGPPPPTASTSPASSATGWGSGAGRWSPAAPTASTPPRTAARWPRRRRPSRCWPAASTGPTRPRTARCSHRIAESGLLVSEWPPGCAPQRHRFLVRNRLIAAPDPRHGRRRGGRPLGCAGHRPAGRRGSGKPVMVVPGPGDVAMSVGLPRAAARRGARARAGRVGGARRRGGRRLGADLADPPERPAGPRDGLVRPRRAGCSTPARCAPGSSPERLAAVAGCDVLDVLRVLPALELRRPGASGPAPAGGSPRPRRSRRPGADGARPVPARRLDRRRGADGRFAGDHRDS